MARDIAIHFMPPGILDFGVIDETDSTEITGYGPVGLGYLHVDRDVKTGEYVAFSVYNFDKTFSTSSRNLTGIHFRIAAIFLLQG